MEDPIKDIARMQELGDNQHVIKCVEALEDEENIYIITPKAKAGTLTEAIGFRLPGKSLSFMLSWIHQRRSTNQLKVWKIFRQIVEVLKYLEAHGICHHDLSPDNFVFLTEDNLVVIDLALSIKMPVGQNGSRTLIKPKGAFGKVVWMDPLVFGGVLSKELGTFDGVSYDLWAAALMLYSMVTGQLLYQRPWPTERS